MDPQTWRNKIIDVAFDKAATLGMVEGVKVREVLGYLADVPAAGEVPVIPQGGAYIFPSDTGEEMELVSSDAGDAGYLFRLELLDANFEEKTVFMVVNGTTPTTVPEGPYTRVNNITNVSELGATSGDVSVQSIGGGNVYSVANVQDQTSNQAVFTVPAGKTGFITRVQNSLNRQGTLFEVDAKCIVRFVTTPVGRAPLQISRWGLNDGSTSVSNIDIQQSQPVPEKLDIVVVVDTTNPDSDVTCAFTIMLFDNEYLPGGS